MYNGPGDAMKETIDLINAMRMRLGWDKTDDLTSLIRYLNEEVVELTIESQKRPIDQQALIEELADVLMVALALTDDLGVSAHQIIQEKIEKVVVKYESS